jgi:hypothetical protein
MVMTKVNVLLEGVGNGEGEDLLGEEAEAKEKDEEIIDLVDAVLDEQGVNKKSEVAFQEEREVAEDVLEKDSEVNEKLFESAQWEVVSRYPSGQQDAGKETVPGQEMEEVLGDEPEPSIDFEEQIKLDEGLKEIFSEENTGTLKDPLFEEAVEEEIQDKQQPSKEAFAEKENLMEEDERSLQVARGFARFVNTGEESFVEHFTREEIETTLSQVQTQKDHPIYEAIEKRIAHLREREQHERETSEEKWEGRIIGFISGLTVALIIVLLRKYLLPF